MSRSLLSAIVVGPVILAPCTQPICLQAENLTSYQHLFSNLAPSKVLFHDRANQTFADYRPTHRRLQG